MFYSLWVKIKERLCYHNPTECSHFKSICKTSVHKHVCVQQLTFHCAPAAHPFGPFPLSADWQWSGELRPGPAWTLAVETRLCCCFISVQNSLLCIHFYGNFSPLLNLHICAHLCHPLLLIPVLCRSFNSTQWVAHLGARTGAQGQKVTEF